MTRTDPAPILLIEDTSSLRAIYQAMLRNAGFTVHAASTAAEGREAFFATDARIVLLDLHLPDGDGQDLMADMLEHRPETAVIVITADTSINRAVRAMRAGAQDFLVKPFEESRLLGAVGNALTRQIVPEAAGMTAPMGEFIGTSTLMREVYSRIRAVAPSMATVFITGESGTGKEICAHAIHDLSPRAKAPFIALDCGALSPDQMDSAVFGHLRGAFVGALTDKIGAAAQADGGTLFLDEICELDLNLQTKLLRFLQSSEVQPMGAPQSHKVNVRIICATSRNPLDAIRNGQVREDLYYRLHVVPIHMPSLRERGDDIIDMAEIMLDHLAREENRKFCGIAPRVAAALTNYPWPGNVRELMNVLRSVVVMNEGPVITFPMLPADLRNYRPEMISTLPARAHDMLAGHSLAQIERLAIEMSLRRHDGSVPRAARELEVAPSTIYRKLNEWAGDKSDP